MGKLIKRFGSHIVNVILDFEIVEEMDLKYYGKKIGDYEESGKVYVVPIRTWTEDPLCEFFMKTFRDFGFEDLILERTERYLQLKKEMGFYGYPDFLVLKDGRWLRLEVEAFSHSYGLHPPNYSEFLLCFDETTHFKWVKTFTVREFVGCDEIINFLEIPNFLYLYNEEFRQDYDERFSKRMYRKMGIV